MLIYVGYSTRANTPYVLSVQCVVFILLILTRQLCIKRFNLKSDKQKNTDNNCVQSFLSFHYTVTSNGIEA